MVGTIKYNDRHVTNIFCHITIVMNDTCTTSAIALARVVNYDRKQFEASLTDDSRVVTYN